MFDKSAPKPTVLVVENGTDISSQIRANAGPHAFDVHSAGDGTTALLMAPRINPNLIVLDVALTKVDWQDFYRLIRSDEALAGTPVLVLTDKVEPLGQLPDFTIGNTDFAVKPFHPAELVLRIRRLLFNWQIASRESGIMAYEDLKLDVSRHEVLADGRTVHLTATEFKLLATLAQRRGRVQTRDRLLQDVCDYSNSSQLFTRTIDTHMRRLRNKLGPAQWHLETVRGVGFRFREKPAGESWTPATFGRRRGRVDGLANGRKRSRPWV